MSTFTALFIEFYTANLEAPFAYANSAEITKIGDKLQVDYRAEYIDREDFTKEELIDEGLSPEDGFSSKCELNEEWAKAIDTLVSKTKLHKDEEDRSCFLKIQFKDGSEKQGYALDIEAWDYLVQELHQAVLENLGKEYPLSIQFLENDEKKTICNKSLVLSFLERKGVLLNGISGTEIASDLSWQEAKDIMEQIYAFEYKFEQGLEKEPKAKGSYLDLGEGIWLTVPNSIVNAGKQKPQIQEMLDNLKNM